MLHINQCQPCNKIKKLTKKKERAIKNKIHKKEQKYKNKIQALGTHKCLKTFKGSSKSMEADAIFQMVLNFPTKNGAYVRKLCIDDDATTPAHLQEDTGPDSKGRLPTFLTGITVLADPTHRKCVVRNAFYKLAGKKVRVSRIKNHHAAKLREYFGYWVKQSLKLTLDEMR